MEALFNESLNNETLTTMEAERPDVALTKEDLKPGAIGAATFNLEKDPKRGDQWVSKDYGNPPKRKIMFIDEQSAGFAPIPGIQYYVKVMRDTSERNEKGALIVRLVEPTPAGTFKENIQRAGGMLIGDGIPIAKKADLPDDKVNDCLKHYANNSVNSMLRLEKLALMDHATRADGSLDPDSYSLVILPGPRDISDDSVLPIVKAEDVLQGNLVIREEAFSMSMQPIEVTTLRGKPAIRIHNVEVPIREEKSPFVPNLAKFEYFTYDVNTTKLLAELASAYNRRSSAFLEGSTATSKTSAVEFFGTCINAGVLRLNFNGQTDTSEIIGKFIPNDESQRLKFETLIRGYDNPDDQIRAGTMARVRSKISRELLQRAYSEGRVLTEEENVDIAQQEGLNISKSTWIWQDGAAPYAMKNGLILLLDELTLGPPQVVERMNPMLERHPTLILSENGGAVIKPAEGFWVVGTGNPAGYAGRSQFSDALLRRFRDYILVPEPTAETYTDMLVRMVYGRQPDIRMDGILYKSPATSDTELTSLAEYGETNSFLPNLARFHADVVKLANPSNMQIGRDRFTTGGKYVFVRDTLTSVIEYMANEQVLDIEASRRTGTRVYVTDFWSKARAAITKFYLNPVNPSDRDKIKDAITKYAPAVFR